MHQEQEPLETEDLPMNNEQIASTHVQSTACDAQQATDTKVSWDVHSSNAAQTGGS